MRRAILAAAVSALLLAQPFADARLLRSSCSGPVHESGPHDCSFILAGPVTGTATALPGEDGVASVRLVITFDPRNPTNTSQRLLAEPEVLAECSATAFREPATCSAEWHGDFAQLPTFGPGQHNGNGLPGRCTATGTGSKDGSFSCVGGTV